MFFSGDPTVKKKVDLGGRSGKERDRQKLLLQTKLEREQRQRWRIQTQSAKHIQKFVRGRREVAAVRPVIRSEFCAIHGEFGERADRTAFQSSAKYLPQLFFFFQASNDGDMQRLVVACRLLKQSLIHSNMSELFAADANTPEWQIASHRQKRLASLCVLSLYVNCISMKLELLKDVHASAMSQDPSSVLLETLLIVTNDDSPWGTAVMDHLLRNKLFHFLRHILLQVQPDANQASRERSYLEYVVCCLAKRYVQRVNAGTSLPLQWGFPCQVLSIPLLWQRYPSLKRVFVDEGLWGHSIHLIAKNLSEFSTLLPPYIKPEFPSSICLLGNLLEVAAYGLSRSDCTLQLATDFAVVGRYMLEDLPSSFFRSAKDKNYDVSDDPGFDEDMDIDEPGTTASDPALEQQLLHAADPEFLQNLVRVAFLQFTSRGPALGSEAEAVGATCAFLYSLFMTLPTSNVITGLAYKAQLVPHLWSHIKRYHRLQSWPSIEFKGRKSLEIQNSRLLGWMLPLAVFCPVYSYLLMSIDNEDFYEQQRPLSLPDIVQLVSVLKEALWQLLWVLTNKQQTGPVQKPGLDSSTSRKLFSTQMFQPFVSKAASRLLAELHDRNSRRQFTPSEDFHAREGVDEVFVTQAEGEHTRAQDVLRQAPFLVPFKDRVRIFTSHIAAARAESGPHNPMGRIRIKIRRDHITEDAFAQLNEVSADALKGTIRVTFVNELGVEEAGVDGGGIFKDFMEGITKTGFDVQYGLFKETADHLLYPNPASQMVSDEHLQYFEFFGKILGKAMSEGILVDIPFANFFLSKLRKKHNYLHDLPSLDPELYQNLLFLKHYDGDLSQLAVYFVVMDNEYGEQTEVELIPGGRDIQVTNDNVIKYIHLVAHHRLNTQIHQQSHHFLHGFQQVIHSEWIDMFNEHEIQILISGSQEGMDVDDLRKNAHYAGGYDEKHPVIEMFWEVVQKLEMKMQQKFLKFVTGCSRGPLLGFKHLEPQFCIQRAFDDGSQEALDRLPTSATCMNLLKLPPYKSKEIIQEKLLYAITAGAGFDLS
ncbi:hypothetical protein KC19_2G168200 [Ceratodon purpureus]|uniref:HECT-type E3 ubiquitin transferase n=1 Tax=Ceratodon purpureus TaxID=3225 RepID=A0A8T0IX36_CERPU|nr:hypothetical protein KC19_2G168200 [Ceratodon purpureus]